jgi:predicted GNAT family N-acyltransferase
VLIFDSIWQMAVIKYDSPEYESMCELRDEVLRKPIGLRLTKAERERDKHDILIACLENDKAIACCILTKIDEDYIQLRQMAVAPEYQQMGIGKNILSFAEKIAGENHYSFIRLHARKVAVGFYEKQGYITVGEEFTEVGIPHFEMTKNICNKI